MAGQNIIDELTGGINIPREREMYAIADEKSAAELRAAIAPTGYKFREIKRPDGTIKMYVYPSAESAKVIQKAITDNTRYRLHWDVMPFEKQAPFEQFWDEALAKQAAEKEFDPYFEEQLQNYIDMITTQRGRSEEDLTKTLSFLGAEREAYLSDEQLAWKRAIEDVAEGYSRAGTYFSGARQKDIREREQMRASKLGAYQREYERATGGAQTSYDRLIADLAREETLKRTEIERGKKEAIAGGVLTRRGEAQEEYEEARRRYYEDINTGAYAGMERYFPTHKSY